MHIIIMLKCSTFGCTDPPKTQCNNADGQLFCNKCISVHIERHGKDNFMCSLGEIKIKLSKAKLVMLRNSIKESINEIEKQKQKILDGAEKVISQVRNLVKQALDQLDKMIEEYSVIYNKTEFEENNYNNVQAIINKKLVFDDPLFLKIGGELIKNTKIIKNSLKSADKENIHKEFGLLLEGHTSFVYSVAITIDNRFVVSGSWDNSLRVWNLLRNQQEAVLRGHTSYVISVAITSDNRFVVSGSCDKTIRVWNLLEKQQDALLQGHISDVNSVAITSDNHFVISGSSDNTVRIWSLLNKQQEGILQGHTSSVLSVAITSDNRFIVSGSNDKTIIVWNMLEKQQKLVFNVDLICFAIANNNRFIVSGSNDKIVRVWSFFEGKQEAVFKGHRKK